MEVEVESLALLTFLSSIKYGLNNIQSHKRKQQVWILMHGVGAGMCAWLSVCACMNSCTRAFVWMRVFLIISNVSNHKSCVCLCVFLSKWFRTYIVIDSRNIYGSYCSSASSQGQFAFFKKKPFLKILLFFPSGLFWPIFYNPGWLLLFWGIRGRSRPPNPKEP